MFRENKEIMKKIRTTTIMLLAAIAMTSCSTTVPVAVSNQAIGSRDGQSSTTVLFGIELNGKFSLKDATENGEIYKGISTVDMKTENYFFYVKKTLLVTGE